RVHHAPDRGAADARVGGDPRVRTDASAGGHGIRRPGLSRADRHVVPGLAGAYRRARRGAVARRPRVPGRRGARGAARGRVPIRVAVAEDGAAGERAEPDRHACAAGARPPPSGADVRGALPLIALLALAAVAEATLPAPPFTL